MDVVSDILDQANNLLGDKKVHPAAAVVLIGSALEEFLRNWIEDLDLKTRVRSIEAYAKVLRESEQITTQDMKDLTSWNGLRNAAAHGRWDEVSDKQRSRLMLEGVNLFMRRYAGTEGNRAE